MQTLGAGEVGTLNVVLTAVAAIMLTIVSFILSKLWALVVETFKDHGDQLDDHEHRITRVEYERGDLEDRRHPPRQEE